MTPLEEYKAQKIAEIREKFMCYNDVLNGIYLAKDAEAFLSQTIDELGNGKADMIVDLYQIKASLNRPRSSGEMETPEDIYHYHFLMTIISKLCDINDIRGEDIEEAIRRRAEAERMRGGWPSKR